MIHGKSGGKYVIETSFRDIVNTFDSEDFHIRKMEEFFLWCDFRRKNKGILPSTQTFFCISMHKEQGKGHKLHIKPI